MRDLPLIDEKVAILMKGIKDTGVPFTKADIKCTECPPNQAYAYFSAAFGVNKNRQKSIIIIVKDPDMPQQCKIAIPTNPILNP